MLSSLASTMRLASLAICLVVIASFALFVVNQTSTAAAHQQRLVNGALPTPGTVANGAPSAAKSPPPQESSLRRAVDDTANAFTSPFSGVTAGWSSEWVIRATNLLLVLIVYGFGLGFLARVIRVRV